MAFTRKTIHETIRGKVQWAKVKNPNKFGRWSIDVYPDSESMEKVRKLKEDPAIKNTLKKDDNGEYITFSRDTQKLMRGKMVTFTPPIILDKNNAPSTDSIGNGSDCDVTLEVYGWPAAPGRAAGRAARLHAVKVWDLVPFEARNDFTEEEQKQVRGLLEAPAPSW